jgi:hypothetical protein
LFVPFVPAQKPVKTPEGAPFVQKGFSLPPARQHHHTQLGLLSRSFLVFLAFII